MTNLFVTVTGTPTGLSAIRTGCNTVQLSWTAPASNAPPVAGYEVFYVVSGSDSTQSGGTTTNTSVSIEVQILGFIYDFFVVAYSDSTNTLPSAHSNSRTIDLGEFLNDLNVKNFVTSLDFLNDNHDVQSVGFNKC